MFGINYSLPTTFSEQTWKQPYRYEKIPFFEKQYLIDLNKSESLCNVQTDHVTIKILKAVLHTIFLVDCWKICLMYS